MMSDAPRGLSLPVHRLIRENVSILLTHAFAREPLRRFRTGFVGESWANLDETVFGMGAQRAEKAALELALLLRYLDDEQAVSDQVKARINFGFGRLFLKDGTAEELSLREVTNKIIHAVSFDWNHADLDRPKLVCNSRDNERWVRAEIELIFLAAVCGNFAG